MSISDDARAHSQRCNDYLRPYANAHGDFTNIGDFRTVISMATIKIERAAEAARKLNGSLPSAIF